MNLFTVEKSTKIFFKGEKCITSLNLQFDLFQMFFFPKYTIQGKAEGIEPAYYSIVWADRYN